MEYLGDAHPPFFWFEDPGLGNSNRRNLELTSIVWSLWSQDMSWAPPSKILHWIVTPVTDPAWIVLPPWYRAGY